MTESTETVKGRIFPLAPGALFSIRAHDNNQIRAARARRHMGQPTDGPDPDHCWELAGERAQREDPGAHKAFARLLNYLDMRKKGLI